MTASHVCWTLLLLFSRQVMSDSLQPYGLQHARPPCLSASSLPKFMSFESGIPSNHLLLCHPRLLPSVFPSIRVFSNDSAVCMRWLKYWSFSFSISPSSKYSKLISFRINWFDLLVFQGTQESFPAPQFKSINSSAFCLFYGPTLTSVRWTQ